MTNQKETRGQKLGIFGMGVWMILGGALLGFLLTGCNGGGGGGGGQSTTTPAQQANGTPPAPVTSTPVLDPSSDLPGVVLTIGTTTGASGKPGAGPTGNSNGISGASRKDGTFQVGDKITVTFYLTKKDGTALNPADLDYSSIFVSGPTFNYQPVIYATSNWHKSVTQNADGTYSYTLPTPIPATYLAPLNSMGRFTDGVLQGQPLLAGTYTVGMEAFKNYNIGGSIYRDPGNATQDFQFGGATTITPREVVKVENCNQCHVTLQLHGGTRRLTKLCVLCHTAGAEGRTIAGGPPVNTIEFKVMIHKIHNGKHLPSVLGVSTNPDGTRNYSATPQPYKIVGYHNTILDFSTVGFPVWPNLNIPMPRNQGYSALTPTQQATDDTIREGVTACDKCHGDNGFGAPAQGDLAYTEPSKRACGACHDDVVWGTPYAKNGKTMMPADQVDSQCADCHVNSSDPGDPPDVKVIHKPPLIDPTLNPGLDVAITNVTPSTGPTLTAGGKLSVTFSIKNDAGTDIQPAGLGLNVMVTGPTTNRNVVLYASIPTAALGAVAGSYTMNLPEIYPLELLGTATGGADVFNTSKTPIWTSGTTTVYQRTAKAGGGSSTLSVAATAMQNYVDVVSSTNFVRGDYVVIDDGTANEEYLKVQYVDGNRLWFSSTYDQSLSYGPWLRNAHTAGAAVTAITLTSQATPAAWSITNAATGQITLVAGQFGVGNKVIVSYTSDFVLPTIYPPTLNDSPNFDMVWGKWTGKTMVDGTYTVGIWGYYTWNYVVNLWDLKIPGETNSYRVTSPPATKDFLVGTATTITPYSLISSGNNCNTCHNDIWYHGGSRRGFNTCILCHGNAGAEDRPQYVAANAPATNDVTINFRMMLHKIHMGADLNKASTYTVVGYGHAAYPNNFGANTFGDIVFPAMPGKVKHCTTCHGTSTAWQQPADRSHPTQQTKSMLQWNAVCTSCHDSDDATVHIAQQINASGSDSCSVCHATDRDFNVPLMHKNR